MYRSYNVAARIFERQTCSPAPGTSFNCARRFYENIVPSRTIFDIQCPDILLRKFSEDGLYLITFSKDQHSLIVYRPTWLSFSCREQECEYNLPPKANKFQSYFTKLYTLTLAAAREEHICKDFFLYVEKTQFGLFVTSTSETLDMSHIGGVTVMERIIFHLVRLEDGVILDQKVYINDYISLAHCIGVYLYDDLLAIVSLRYQRIYILQIRDSGNLVDVRCIGEYCREDDELFLNSNAQCTSNPIRNQTDSQAPFLGGLKQRLLSSIFRGIWNEEGDPRLVQFLDRHHLLIKFGSVDSAGRSTNTFPAFFAVYNMETTEIISFYQSSSDELYALFELFCNHFHWSSKNSFQANFLSTHSNNIHALELLRSNRNKTSSQYVKKVLSVLPMSCQSQSPSPYFDHSLFRYDEKLISATEEERQPTEHPMKFISKKHNTLKFKIHAGPESGAGQTWLKNVFIFHPILPLVISVQQSLVEAKVVNIHFRAP